MFSESGSASSRLTSIEVLHSTEGEQERIINEHELNHNATNVILLCLFLMQSYRSRWGGSSSRAGCCRWFPADTWSSLVAQNKDSWWRKRKKKSLFCFLVTIKNLKCNPAPPFPFTLHIFHRISFWVFRFGGFKWEHASKRVWTPTKNQRPGKLRLEDGSISQLQNAAFYVLTMLFKTGHSHTKRWISSVL